MYANGVIEEEAPEVEAGFGEVEAGFGEVEGVDEDELGDGLGGALLETVVILTFMPWPQWPNVPQAK